MLLRAVLTRVRRTLAVAVLALRARGILPPAVLPPGARLTTYNIGRGARGAKGARSATLDRVAATIAAGGADVVALQEVHEPDVPVIVDALRDHHGLDYHAEFAASLTADAMEARIARATAAASTAPGADEAFWADRRSAFGVALLSRQPLVDVRVERLPGRGEPRVALLARTDVAGRPVTVVVTHLATASKPTVRDEQTQAVLALAEAVPGPVLVAGDLNQEPAEVAAALAGRVGRVGSLRPATEPHTPTLGLRAIDHVLVGPGVEARGAAVGDRGVSDHRPVTVALRL